jgi:hypothetical protein
MPSNRGETKVRQSRRQGDPYQAFESMPRVIRNAMNDAYGPICPLSVAAIYQKSCNVEKTLAAIRDYNERKSAEVRAIYAKEIQKAEFKSLDRELGLI